MLAVRGYLLSNISQFIASLRIRTFPFFITLLPSSNRAFLHVAILGVESQGRRLCDNGASVGLSTLIRVFLDMAPK